ncbi:MAG: TfoX/Sxy family protein [Pseudomonadota bacterium]
MAVDREFETYLGELLEPVGSVTMRRMFGGLAIFRHGLMFGLVVEDDRVCLKADDGNRQAFLDENLEEWAYEGKGKPMKMGYWHIPERLLEDTEEMAEWALHAFDAAARIDQLKPPSQRKLKL